MLRTVELPATDPAAARAFYAAGASRLALMPRSALAKHLGVDDPGDAPGGLVLEGADDFTDPDGFTWRTHGRD